MSYILEALADSEQARREIAAVPRYSLLPAVGEEPRRQRVWPYVLAGALLANALVLQLWLRAAPPGGVASIGHPRAAPVPQDAATAPVLAVAAPLPQAAQTPAAAAEPRVTPSAGSRKPTADAAGREFRQTRLPQPAPEHADARRVARPGAPNDPIALATADSTHAGASMPIPRSAPRIRVKRSADVAPVAGTSPGAAPARATPTPSSPAPGGDDELSPALQKELPALSVAGFIRDEGSASMVILNDKLAREGDEVAPGVRLEHIRNDGLVFSYKGYRFKR